MLHSIDLIKSLKAKGLPSAEAEFGLSKDLRHGMSDGFIEKYITVANKQSLGRWYLQSECYAASSKIGAKVVWAISQEG